MKIKTSELTGAALDWAVAKAVGLYAPEPWISNPSTNWSQGGPIIERAEIDLTCSHYEGSSGEMWDAACEVIGKVFGGPTPLIAAMRCFCCAKLGDEIEIPEELQPCQPPNLY